MTALVLTLLLQGRSELNAVERTVQRDLVSLGGKLKWVVEGTERTLCLDLTLDDKPFDFSRIQSLTRLGVLRIFRGRIKERTIRHLRHHPSLKILVMLSDGLTDAGLALVSDITGLTKLDVKGETISGKGLGHLSRLKNLDRLFLYNTRLRDADLAPLTTLKGLSEVVLPKTVSQRALDRLRAKLPQTKVTQI